MELPAPTSTRPRKALFVTFYSFKGGVGRTMALYNTAAILAGLGRRVLLIDFDLEAPGLSLFQNRQKGPGAAREQPGLVDALVDFMDTPETAPLTADDPSAFLDAYTSGLDIPPALRRTDGGTLDLLPTGRLDDDYENRLYRLPFRDLFEGGVGVPMFARFKGLIQDSDRYDYVFVDSRTGLSDEGSICTRYLADALLVITGLNHQNLRGTARFLKQSGVVQGEGGPRQIGFVASPVPTHYEDLRAERMQAATGVLNEAGLTGARFVAEIPYHPIVALDEDPNAHDLSRTALYDAYRDIQGTIQEWAGDRPDLRLNEAIETIRKGQTKQGLVEVIKVSREAPRAALQALAFTSQTMVDQKPAEAALLLEEQRDLARELRDLRSEATALGNLGVSYYYLSKLTQAIESFEQALAISQEVGDKVGESGYLGNLGSAFADLGDRERSIELYEQALAVAREVGDKRNEAVHLSNLGNRYSEFGEATRAVELYEQALAIAREASDRKSEGVYLGHLANRYADIGEVAQALELYEQALAIVREFGDQSNEGVHLGNLGNLYAELGETARAIELYEQAVVISREVDDRKSEGIDLGNLGNRYAELGETARAIELYEQALAIAREVDDKSSEGHHLANLGVAFAVQGHPDDSTEALRNAGDIADALGRTPLQAAIRVDEVEALATLNSPRALAIADENWSFITDHAPAFELARAQVLRARLRAAHGDSAGAAEDARAALALYRPNGVDSVWSREAEEILKATQPEA